jgi:hypothetical protein
MKATRPKKRQTKPAPRMPIYGPAWGRWIMANVRRDLRSGALRKDAGGRTLH